MDPCRDKPNPDQNASPVRPDAALSQVGHDHEGSTGNQNQNTVLAVTINDEREMSSWTEKSSKILKATDANDIPREVFFNILSRLPAKVLARCKCVSKRFLNLIENPFFQQMHFEKSKRDPHLLLLDQSAGLSAENDVVQVARYSVMTLHSQLRFRFLDLTKGYINLLPSWYGLVCFYNHGTFRIINPTSGQFVRVAEGHHCTSDKLDATFGYNPDTNEYKLVHLYDCSRDELETDIHCEILTVTQHCGPHINRRSWRQIEATCPHMVSGNGVLVDKKCYWIIWSETENDNNDQLIVRLDLETETFGTITHPAPTSYDEGNDEHLIELQGFLCLVDTFAAPCKTDFWILTDPVEIVWEKKYTIDLMRLEGFDDELTQISPLGFSKGEIVIYSGQEGLDFWNVETGVIRRGDDMGFGEDNMLTLFVESFFELGRQRRFI